MVFDVELEGNVLAVHAFSDHANPFSMLLASIQDTSVLQPQVDAHMGSLEHFHLRFVHLAYDTIKSMAQEPASGIDLTDKIRPVCVKCALGKQIKGLQSKKDLGLNALVDSVGGVICSDLKEPITSKDRLDNRYLVNFIDHKSNNCRLFLAKTKDQAVKEFRDFFVFFEKQFNCRIHVLRTDGGGEYMNVDLFCKEAGVARKVSEARNQASNGKAERMHCTVLNMARCMVFASSLLLCYWRDC